MLRHLLLASALFPFGCAQVPLITAQSRRLDPARLAETYRAVRAGARTSARANGYLFCATREGLQISRLESAGSDPWADKIRDSWVTDGVRDLLADDPRLRGEQITVKAYKGEVALTGSVSSDVVALRAVRDALVVSGAVVVNAELTSPESPGPVAHVENRGDKDCRW